jgi:hypothetical protein
MTEQERLALRRRVALRRMDEETKIVVAAWLDAEAAAYARGDNTLPSYTDSACGAEHALEGISTAIHDSLREGA